jgi:ribulose-5-phosphate 4-epimerase/fuculose-1-phosphate aldolase
MTESTATPTTPEAAEEHAPTAAIDAERAHRKLRLAASFRLFGAFGFDEGVAGHITARDPEFADRFWVNPFGMSFKQICVGDLLLVDHHGTVLVGDRPVNRAAFAIHSAIHAARPDVVAAAHSHSVYGRAVSTMDALLEPLTQDACAFYDDHVRFDEYTGIVNDPEEGARIAAALGDNKAAILANHGLLTVGTTVESAVWWYITMERSAQVQLAAYGAGSPQPIAHEVAARTCEQLGNEVAGLFQFGPLFDWILAAQPDLGDC